MAGSVESVQVTNFLNHHNLTVDMCPGVNFITGENGSGKSAILTALCVALVRRAHSTPAQRRCVASPAGAVAALWRPRSPLCALQLSLPVSLRRERARQRAPDCLSSPHPPLTRPSPVTQGASARSTNRAESGAKSFVREGAQSARVVVRLRNTGHDAFRPEEFGPTIVVERNITAVRLPPAVATLPCSVPSALPATLCLHSVRAHAPQGVDTWPLL